MKISSFALIWLFIWMLNSCDLFGQDDGPKPKSTEFAFRLDTLHGTVGSFEDVHIFDDTSFVIAGSFFDRNVEPNVSFNQIWWGKKRGVFFNAY